MNQLLPAQLKRSSFSPETKLSEENQRFLGFSIGDRLNALIPLEDLRATIKISLSEILPVPQMKESLLGIINYGCATLSSGNISPIGRDGDVISGSK